MSLRRKAIIIFLLIVGIIVISLLSMGSMVFSMDELVGYSESSQSEIGGVELQQYENNYDLQNPHYLKTVLQDETITFKQVENINVCVIDIFTPEKEEEAHGVKVSKLINKRYEGPIIQIDAEKINYYRNADLLNDCDVINYSMSVSKENRNIYHLYQTKKFMENYKGIFVAASGNEIDTADESQWSGLKKEEPEHWNPNFYIIGQGEAETVDTNVVTASTGEEIDFVVLNDGEIVANRYTHGSSFSTPVVTSVIANLLSAGYTKEEINYVFHSLEATFYYEGIKYKEFPLGTVYRKANELREYPIFMFED